MKRFQEIKNLISSGKIVRGSTANEIRLLLGEPDDYTHKEIRETCRKPQCWKYGDVEIWFHKGKLIYSQVDDFYTPHGDVEWLIMRV